MRKKKAVHCSWCGKSEDQVKRLVVGPGKNRICGGCVDHCARMIAEFKIHDVHSLAASLYEADRSWPLNAWLAKWAADKGRSMPVDTVIQVTMAYANLIRDRGARLQDK